jgi:RNA polymerase sigma-70 factor (ECF subfamily)
VNTRNDRRLIHAAQRGSPEAFNQLVRGFDWPVLQLALRITGTEPAARSIYSETMLRMRASLAAFQCECSLCLCAHRIIAQLCLDYLYGDRGRALDSAPGGKIGRILTSLSPRERIVFELRHYQGLELKTVSKVLDISEELARNVLLRACHKLRPALLEL